MKRKDGKTEMSLKMYSKRKEAEKQAALFDLLFDAALTNQTHLYLDKADPVILPLEFEEEMITEVVGIADNNRYIHHLLPEPAEFIKRYPNIVEVNIWNDLAGEYFRQLPDEELYSIYINTLDWMDRAKNNNALDVANKLAGELRKLFKIYDIIPWWDGEQHLLD